MKTEQLEFLIFQLLSGVDEMTIAKNLQISVNQLRKITNSEKFNELWNDILQTIRSRIEDKLDRALDIAVNRMIDLVNSTDEKIALEASKSLLKLKYGNFDSISKTNVLVNAPTTNNTPNIVELIKAYRKERKLINND